MSSDDPKVTNSTNSTCGCGGCGTGTTCCSDVTFIGSGDQDGVYAYATPDPLAPWTPSPYVPPRDTTDGTDAIRMEDLMRTTLQDEMMADLLKRVQRLEQQLKDTQTELAELKAAKDEAEDPFEGLGKLLDELLKNVRRHLDD